MFLMFRWTGFVFFNHFLHKNVSHAFRIISISGSGIGLVTKPLFGRFQPVIANAQNYWWISTHFVVDYTQCIIDGFWFSRQAILLALPQYVIFIFCRRKKIIFRIVVEIEIFPYFAIYSFNEGFPGRASHAQRQPEHYLRQTGGKGCFVKMSG